MGKRREFFVRILCLTVLLFISTVSPGSAGTHPSSGLSKGKFLVAARDMADPRFRETVILLIQYDRNGAMGLIINLPSATSLATILPEISEFIEEKEKVFVGGPVALNQVFVIARSDSPPEASYHIFRDIYVIPDLAAFEKLLKRGKRGDKFRVFAGYAGWAEGQLAREIAEGQWHVMTADEKFLFEEDPSLVWKQLIILSSGVRVRI